jgi:hypothetical protein
MSFPHHQEVLDRYQGCATDLIALLKQYRQLCTTLEGSLGACQAALRQSQELAERAVRDRDDMKEKLTTKEAECQHLQEQIVAMRDHPDVKAARLQELTRQKSVLEAEMAKLSI